MSGTALAQDAGKRGNESQNEPDARLPQVTVTATRSDHEVRTAPASVTLVPREEFETRNASNLLEAVRGTPGITLQPRQVGGRKTIALRGLQGRHTLTLSDGRRISPSDDVVGHSDYQYGWLPMSAIERIEVIRGPMSTLYGSEALGGVINIITRQPTDRWIGAASLTGTELTSGSGGDGHRGGLFAAGPVTERLGLRLSAEASRMAPVPLKEDRRYDEIEGSKARSVSVGGSFRINDEQQIEANLASGREERYYNDVDRAGTVYESRYPIERTQTHLAWIGRFSTWHGQLRAYRSEIDIRNERTMGVAPTRPQNLKDEVIDGFAALRLGNHTLTFGGEVRDETLENAGLVGGKDSALHKALFIQDELPLGHQVVLTAGVRADHHELFGTELSPRAYLVWEASPELVIKGGYGHAFKAPTLKQISPSYVGAEGPHTFLGNADIQPEVSDSIEIGADWQRGSLGLRATLFRTEVKDLITYRLISVVGPRRTYLYDNIDRARLTGLEAGFTRDIRPGLTWTTDLLLLRTRDEATGKRLEDRPNTSGASHLDWRFGSGWSTRAGLEYIGSQTSAATGLPSYMLWNASVGKRLSRNFTVRAGIENIGDVRLQEESPAFGYAERGRTVFVTLSAEL
ncbi:MAG TPA: TonB-dependent receptor [Burkholderiaceae bacterium]|nr:TonB-dependent receptor [Burkholderiaceae bacterium]